MSKDTVLHAISALYNHDDADIRKQADKWLESWRMSSEAWSAADNILHDPSSPGEAHVFAAQTLRLKVQCSALPVLLLMLCCSLQHHGRSLVWPMLQAVTVPSALCLCHGHTAPLRLQQRRLLLMWPSAIG